MKTAVIALLSLSGIALVTPVGETKTLPLAGIRLVAERPVSPAEVAAATRNQFRNGNHGQYAITFAWRARRPAPLDLVAVDLR